MLAISGTKPDDLFRAEQFKIPGYASYFRLNQNGGGILVFVREHMQVNFYLLKRNSMKFFYLNLTFIKRNCLCAVLITQTNLTSPDI